MKRYKLKKDLPTFGAGDEFFIPSSGGLWLIDGYDGVDGYYGKIMAYAQSTLDKFPNILTDWFEEIPEEPKTVWDLEDGEDFFLVDSSEAEVFGHSWENKFEPERSLGDVFLTREDAEKELARRKAKVILERDTKGFKPDWTVGTGKYEVYYDYVGEGLMIEYYYNCCGHPDLWFATAEDAKASIKVHPNAWKTYLGVEE